MKAINGELSAQLCGELTAAMEVMLSESINACPEEDRAWYENCTMEDYYSEWPMLYDDNGECLGEGIDTGWHKIILGDDNRRQFEECFAEALRNAR